MPFADMDVKDDHFDDSKSAEDTKAQLRDETDSLHKQMDWEFNRSILF